MCSSMNRRDCIQRKYSILSKIIYSRYGIPISIRKTTLPPYTDQLDSARRDVFEHLGAFSGSFILAGETAMMLHIGHRRSYDFDSFTQKKLPKTLRHQVRKLFGSSIITEVDEEWMLTVRTKTGVEVSFVQHPYPLLQNPIKTPSISLFHMDDLAANKANVIGRRPAWRDYVDLFTLLKWNLYSIGQIIQLAEKKFTGEFNPKLFLQQLVYFDDIKIVETQFLKESYTYEEIKTFLAGQVDAYLATVLP